MNTFLERCRIQYAQAGNLKRRTKARRAADGDTACKQTGSEQNADPGSDPKAGIGRTCAHDTEKRRGGSGDYRKKICATYWRFGVRLKNLPYSLRVTALIRRKYTNFMPLLPDLNKCLTVTI